MSRTLTLLFRRDPSRDRESGRIHFTGYMPFWPDGRPVAVGLDAFCAAAQRLLGLGKRLTGCQEKLIKMVVVPLAGRDDEITRISGFRVRRLYLLRTGNIGCIHFLDGTPTKVVFDRLRDDPRVLHWIGLDTLEDGETCWFDLAAVDAETTVAPSRPRLMTVEA